MVQDPRREPEVCAKWCANGAEVRARDPEGRGAAPVQVRLGVFSVCGCVFIFFSVDSWHRLITRFFSTDFCVSINGFGEREREKDVEK